MWIPFNVIQAMPSGPPCTTSSDCQSDECCVSLTKPRGRRTVSFLSLATAPGACHKIGTSGWRMYCKIRNVNHSK